MAAGLLVDVAGLERLERLVLVDVVGLERLEQLVDVGLEQLVDVGLEQLVDVGLEQLVDVGLEQLVDGRGRAVPRWSARRRDVVVRLGRGDPYAMQ